MLFVRQCEPQIRRILSRAPRARYGAILRQDLRSYPSKRCGADDLFEPHLKTRRRARLLAEHLSVALQFADPRVPARWLANHIKCVSALRRAGEDCRLDRDNAVCHHELWATCLWINPFTVSHALCRRFHAR